MKKTCFSFVGIENMSTFATQTKKQTFQSECSAVGSALRSGRRGRAFESPHSDKVKGSFLEYSKLPFIIFRLSGRNRNSRTEIYQPIIS